MRDSRLRNDQNWMIVTAWKQGCIWLNKLHSNAGWYWNILLILAGHKNLPTTTSGYFGHLAIHFTEFFLASSLPLTKSPLRRVQSIRWSHCWNKRLPPTNPFEEMLSIELSNFLQGKDCACELRHSTSEMMLLSSIQSANYSLGLLSPLYLELAKEGRSRRMGAK